MTRHVFDEAIALTRLHDNQWAGQTHPAYANMVGPFGGITTAQVVQALMQHPQRLGDPIALTVNFCAAVADGAFVITAIPVRTNRSTQHWSMALTQGDETAITATAVFAQRRETWAATESGFPQAPAWATLRRADPAKTAAWTSRYDFRFARGGDLSAMPAAEGPDSVSTQWIRDDPPRPLDFLSLAAICDVFYPRIFIRRPVFVPAGTVSMTTYFHADAALLAAQGDAPVLGVARASHFGKGYHDQVAEIWSRDGLLLATSHQIVYFKE